MVLEREHRSPFMVLEREHRSPFMVLEREHRSPFMVLKREYRSPLVFLKGASLSFGIFKWAKVPLVFLKRQAKPSPSS